VTAVEVTKKPEEKWLSLSDERYGPAIIWVDPNIPEDVHQRIAKDLLRLEKGDYVGRLYFTTGLSGLALGMSPAAIEGLLTHPVGHSTAAAVCMALSVVGAIGGMALGLGSYPSVINGYQSRVLKRLASEENKPWVRVIDEASQPELYASIQKFGRLWQEGKDRLTAAQVPEEALKAYNKAWWKEQSELRQMVGTGASVEQIGEQNETSVKLVDELVGGVFKSLPGIATRYTGVDGSKVRSRFDKIRELYGAYMSDPLAILTHPALNDPRETTTGEFIRAYAQASDLAASNEVDPQVLSDAVADVEVSWQAAWYHAQTISDSHLDPKEQASVRKAHALLARALDNAASPAERQASYDKARELLAGIVTLPRQAMAAVEAPLRQLASVPAS
jgi:alkylated DNA nucleotide flippase Atl1